MEKDPDLVSIGSAGNMPPPNLITMPPSPPPEDDFEGMAPWSGSMAYPRWDDVDDCLVYNPDLTLLLSLPGLPFLTYLKRTVNQNKCG